MEDSPSPRTPFAYALDLLGVCSSGLSPSVSTPPCLSPESLDVALLARPGRQPQSCTHGLEPRKVDAVCRLLGMKAQSCCEDAKKPGCCSDSQGWTVRLTSWFVFVFTTVISMRSFEISLLLSYLEAFQFSFAYHRSSQ